MPPELQGGDDAFLEVKSKTKLRAVSGKRLGRGLPGLSMDNLKKGAMAVGKGAVNLAKKNSIDQIEGAHTLKPVARQMFSCTAIG